MNTTSKDKGTIKSKSLVELLRHKVDLKKELIALMKLHENEEHQKELTESIEEIDKFLSQHRIQK